MRILTANPNFANAQAGEGWAVPQSIDATSAVSDLTKTAVGTITDRVGNISSLHVEDITKLFTGFSALSVPYDNVNNKGMFIDEIAGFSPNQQLSIIEGYGDNYTPDSFKSDYTTVQAVGNIPIGNNFGISLSFYGNIVGDGNTLTFSGTGTRGLCAGQRIYISGLSTSAWNGAYTVLYASYTTFKVANTTVGSISGGGSLLGYIYVLEPSPAYLGGSSVTVTALSATTTAYTYTAQGHQFVVGQTVTVSGLSSATYNITGTVTAIDLANSTFTVTVTSGTAGSLATQSGTATSSASEIPRQFPIYNNFTQEAMRQVLPDYTADSTAYWTNSTWTFTATSNSTTSLASATPVAHLVAGLSVSGTYIPAGTTITYVDSTTGTVVLSNATTGSGSTTVTVDNKCVVLPNGTGNNFAVGQVVVAGRQGSSDATQDYVGVITAVSDYVLTLADTPSNSSTYTITGSLPSAKGGVYGNASLTAATSDGTTITYTGANHFFVGDTVSITGFTTTTYNLTDAIIDSVSSTGFTVVDTSVLAGSATGTGVASTGYISYRLDNSDLTIPTGYSVTVAGVTPSAYNLTGTITSADYSSFQIANTSATGTYVSGGTYTITVTETAIGASAVSDTSAKTVLPVSYVTARGEVGIPLASTPNVANGDYLYQSGEKIGQVDVSPASGYGFTTQVQDYTNTGVTVATTALASTQFTIAAASGVVGHTTYATVTTTTAHNYSPGDVVVITGNATYNGTYVVSSVLGTTSFNVANGTTLNTTTVNNGTVNRLYQPVTLTDVSSVHIGMTLGGVANIPASSYVTGIDYVAKQIIISNGSTGAVTVGTALNPTANNATSSVYHKLITGSAPAGHNPLGIVSGSYVPPLGTVVSGTGIPVGTKVVRKGGQSTISSTSFVGSNFQSLCLLTVNTSSAHNFTVGQVVDFETDTIQTGNVAGSPRTVFDVPSSTQFRVAFGTITALSVTAASSDGVTSTTYTTNIANGFQVGDYVTITGASPAGFNKTNVQVTAKPASNQITVGSSSTGSWTSGGSISLVGAPTTGTVISRLGADGYHQDNWVELDTAFTGTLSSDFVASFASGYYSVGTDGVGLSDSSRSTMLTYASSPTFTKSGVFTATSPTFPQPDKNYLYAGNSFIIRDVPVATYIYPDSSLGTFYGRITNMFRQVASITQNVNSGATSTFYVDDATNINVGDPLYFRNVLIGSTGVGSQDNCAVTLVAKAIGITNMVGDGTTMTVTTDGSHYFATGDSIAISGNSTQTLNAGSVSITVTGATTFTYASTVTDTYSGGGTATPNSQYFVVNANLANYALSSTAYSNGDQAGNAIFARVPLWTFGNGYDKPFMLNNKDWGNPGGLSGYGAIAYANVSNKHQTGTVVASWNAGNRYFGTNTTGDIELVSPYKLGSVTGTTLAYGVSAQESSQFVVNPGPNAFPNSGKPNFVDLNASYGAYPSYGVVIVGSDNNQEAVLISGVYTPQGTADPTVTNGNAVVWQLAPNQTFQYDHAAGEPVVLPNILGDFANSHGKDTPVLGSADNGTIAENGVNTSGALIATNDSASGVVTREAYFNFNQPWTLSGIDGTANISTTLASGVTAGSGSVVIATNDTFPTTYPYVFGQRPDIEYSPTTNVIKMLPPQIGRLYGNHPSGSSKIVMYSEQGFVQPANNLSNQFQILINGDTLTCNSMVTTDSTTTFTLASNTTKAYKDLSYISVATLDLLQTYTTLTVPYTYLSTGLSVGKPVTTLTVMPTPIKLYSGMTLSLVYNTTIQQVTLRADVDAGSTLLPVNAFTPHFNFTATKGSNGQITDYFTQVVVGLNQPLNDNDVILLTSGDGAHTQPVAIQNYNSNTTTTVAVERFTPNYAYDNTTTLTYLYPIVLGQGDTQETVYPTTLPVSTTNTDTDAPPYSLSLAYPTVYPHPVGDTFQWYEFPTDPSNGTVTYRPDLDKFYIFSNGFWNQSRIYNVQPYYSILGAQNSTYKDKEDFWLYDPETGKLSNKDSFNNNSYTAYTVNAGSVYSYDPNGNEWTADNLSKVEMKASIQVPQKTQVAIRTVGLHLAFRAGAKVLDVNITPSNLTNLTSQTPVYVNWVYSDPEGDTQQAYEVRIFDDYTYQRPGFSPDTATPIWKVSAGGSTNSVLIDDAHFTSTQRWISGEYYWIYVRVAKNFNSDLWYSDWNYTNFLPLINQPQQPLVSVLSDGTNATNTLVVQSSDNLLGDSNADFRNGIGGWHTGSNDTAGSYITDGSTVFNTDPTWSVTKGELVSALPIGADGYLVAAINASGVTTLKVSSLSTKEAKATGFPIGKNNGTSLPFWVTITNADGTNAENLLVKNTNNGSATKADTFQIIKRAYDPTTRTGSTTGTSKSKGALVSYGLQEPVFTGSTGILSWSYTVMVPGAPEWVQTSPAVAGTVKTVVDGSAKIIKGFTNNRKKVIIEDPNNSLPIGTKNKPAFIRYSTWRNPVGTSGYNIVTTPGVATPTRGGTTFTPSSTNVVWVNQQYTTTTNASGTNDEPVIIESVASAVEPPRDRRLGSLNSNHICGKSQVSPYKQYYITHLEIVVTNDTLMQEWTTKPPVAFNYGRTRSGLGAPTVDGGDHAGTGWQKGDLLRVFGHMPAPSSPEQAAIFVVAENANWQRNAKNGVSKNAQGQTVWTIPVKRVGSIPQIAVPNSGGIAVMPAGMYVHWIETVGSQSKKEVIFSKPYNQGVWANQKVRNGDQIILQHTKTIGGQAATGSYQGTTRPDPQTAYQTFVVGNSTISGSTMPATFGTATVGADGYTTTSVSGWTTSATGTTVKNSSVISGLTQAQTGGLTAGMSVSGTGIPSGAKILTTDLTSITLDKDATANGSGIALTFSVALNAYQNYEIRGQGVPVGAYVVSNTASSAGSFTITISNGCVQFPTAVTGTPGSYDFTLASSQRILLVPPSSKVIPAGSRTLPVAPFYANFAYEGSCPIAITYQPLYGTNVMAVSPQNSGTQVSEIVTAPTVFSEWSPQNSSPVFAGNQYGLMAFSKFIQGRRTVGGTYPQFIPYVDWYDDYGNLITTSDGRQRLDIPSFTGTLTSGSPNITAHNLTSSQVATLQAYLAAGNSFGVTGIGIPANTTVLSLNSTQIVMKDSTGNPANATASISNNTVFTYNNFTKGIALNPIIDYTAYATNFQDVWGQGWCPTYAVAVAPKDFPVAINATSGSVTSSTATYTFGVGLANAIAAGTVLKTTTGFQLIVTVGASAGSTSLSVRFTAGTVPPSTTNILISATRACPRFQWTNTQNTDLYALSAVMFKAMNAPKPTTDYTTLNTTLDTLQTSINTASTTPQNNLALTLNATTPVLGEASIYVLDPVNDLGTREVHFGSGNSALWSKLTTASNAGDTSVTLDSVVGLGVNSSLTVDFGANQKENVTIDTTWTGGATVNLKSPLWYSHKKGAQVFATTAGLASQVAQSQAQGTYVAVFNWNSDSFINSLSDNDSMTVIVERSEDYGNTWNALRKGGKIKLNNAGYATITDYEVIPQTVTYYRVTPSYNTANGKSLAGIPSVGLQAPVITNNSWWIASSSDDTLRYQINVQNGLEESQRHPAGTFYPLGSPYPITVAGVVTGRDGSMTVMWTDPDTWQDFLDFLKRGEIYILLNPVEGERRYIFINQDVSITHHSAPQPYREVKISFVESAPPTYTYVN